MLIRPENLAKSGPLPNSRAKTGNPGLPTTGRPTHECRWTEQLYTELDPDIEPVVRLLNEHGVLTLESCQGGRGHAYGYPTVLFSGGRDTVSKVRELVEEHGLRPIRVRRKRRLFRQMAPFWQLTMHHPAHRKLSMTQRIWSIIKLASGF